MRVLIQMIMSKLGVRYLKWTLIDVIKGQVTVHHDDNLTLLMPVWLVYTHAC